VRLLHTILASLLAGIIALAPFLIGSVTEPVIEIGPSRLHGVRSVPDLLPLLPWLLGGSALFGGLLFFVTGTIIRASDRHAFRPFMSIAATLTLVTTVAVVALIAPPWGFGWTDTLVGFGVIGGYFGFPALVAWAVWWRVAVQPHNPHSQADAGLTGLPI
jgi:hypothetical protein